MRTSTSSLYILLFALLHICTMGISHINAQVTIGSSKNPIEGALLDLKEEGETKRGLMLPRVNLLRLQIPDNKTDLSLTIKDAKDAPWDKDTHIGLVVYHTGDFNKCDPRTFPPGVYTWDGNQWQYLNKKEDISSSEVNYFFDQRDQSTYPYRKFGDAGEWMLENMRYIHPNITPGRGTTDTSQRHYTYPNADLNNPGTIPSSWYPSQGILYSFTAATIGTDPADFEGKSTGQGEIDEDINMKIQGICPTGWHVPSDREWNMLEKEIYENASRYSTYTESNGFPFSPAKWDPDWSITSFEDENFDPKFARGSTTPEGHGRAMISSCPLPLTLPNATTPETGGRSLTTSQGGFNTLLTGVVIQGNHYTDPTSGLASYNHATYFWTSSTVNVSPDGEDPITTKYFRQIYIDGYDGGSSKTVTRFVSPIENYSSLPVRCVKD